MNHFIQRPAIFTKPLWCAALGAVLLAGAPAQAFTIDSTLANGNLIDTSFGSATILSLDLGLLNSAPVSLQLSFDASDAGVLPFNALVKNFIGLGFERITLALTGSQFAMPLGSAVGTFGSVASVAGTPGTVTIRFDGPEYVEAAVGDWYLDGTGVDFGILKNTAGPVTLSITTAVPEPSTYALFGAGLALVGWMARRRRAS